MAIDSFPPPHLAYVNAKMRLWSAWYSGDVNLIANASQQDSEGGYGLKGFFSNTWQAWWGKTAAEAALQVQSDEKIHVPLATDIASMSADMLCADPPRFKSEDQNIQTRLDQLQDEGLVVTLRSALETAAALGGVYLKTRTDFGTRKCSMVMVDPDVADPTFVNDTLISVTFWETVQRTESKVWRHFEHHDMDDAGVGRILHELWVGTADTKGIQIDFDGFEWFFAGIIQATDPETGYISTQTPGLAAVYIPNRLPNPLWKKHAAGRNLGAPDILGSESLLDKLDKMRSLLYSEVDLSRARIMVPEFMMQDMGAGRGMAFDRGQSVYTLLTMPPTTDGATQSIQLFQPDIRVEQYAAIEKATVRDILRRGGYSAASFGELDEGGAAMTATEINSRDARTATTRSNKIALARPRIQEILRKLISIEAYWGWTTGNYETLEVSFPPSGSVELSVAAQAIGILLGVGAMSKGQAVEMLHPEWDDKQRDAELKAIEGDAPEPVSNPDQPGIV